MFFAFFLVLIALAALALFLWPVGSTALLLQCCRRLLGFKTRQVVAGDFRWTYLDGGSGDPLVLLHGIGSDKDSFLLIAGSLAKQCRVIIPDLPGFGASDAPLSAAYGSKVQAERLHQFVEALGLSSFDLGGHSMGGLIAGAFCATHAAQVRTLLLLSPAGVLAAKPSEMMIAVAWGRPLPIFARSVAEMRALIRFVTSRPIWLPRFALVAMAERQRAAYELNTRIVGQLTHDPGLDDYLKLQPGIRTLIIWGRADRAVDSSGAAVLHALLPCSKAVILEGVGHVPMIEAPRQVVDCYEAFKKAATSPDG
jgi:pimeloyl-ACP methyl ester carboxylesterase